MNFILMKECKKNFNFNNKFEANENIQKNFLN